MKKFKLDSNQIIIVLVAFLVGIGVISYIKSDKERIDLTEEKVMEEVVETADETTGGAVEKTSVTTTAPDAASKPSTEFVSGKCSTGLSGYKDTKLNAIVLNWSPCASEDFQFYKLVKSSKNSNPAYPADSVVFSSSNKNVSNFVDKTVAPRTTYYYRMCVVQRLNQVNCSGVATVSY